LDGALHPSAARTAAMLRALGVAGPFREFSESTKTAADAAAALSCERGAIASCLVFILDDEPVVIVKSGASRVDLEYFAWLTDAHSVRQASADEVREATGHSIGGVSPVGWPRAVRAFIDDDLARYGQIWSACGTPHAVFATTYDELRRLTGATPVTLQ
jgi:prolyl-tRNA editing enzyme YbaK/EbsC (Cys-tRNA(Pro) deacylase)